MVVLVLLLSLLASAQTTLPWKKFFLVVFDNAGYNDVLSTSSWKSILEDSFIASNYYSVGYPSVPNYVAQLGGNHKNCTVDSCMLDNSILSLLEARNLTWKGYIENYTPLEDSGCNFNGSVDMSPFSNFASITSELSRCQKVTNETAFQSDIKLSLPDFSYYRPFVGNESLSKTADFFKSWLQNWYYPYMETVWQSTLLMVTWAQDNKTGDDHVLAFFKNPYLAQGLTDTYYNHYSIPKCLQDNWNLDASNTSSMYGQAKCFGYELKQKQQETKSPTTTEQSPKPTSNTQTSNSGSSSRSALATTAMVLGFLSLAVCVGCGIWELITRARYEKIGGGNSDKEVTPPSSNSRLIDAHETETRRLTSAFYLGE